MGRSKWKEDQADVQTKYEKIVCGKAKRKIKTNDYELPFELPENRWSEVQAKSAFAGRVVEVHKRYAFVSSETVKGKIKTSDVWLCTIARKHITRVRAERNFICVGDRVLCRPAESNETAVKTDLPQALILHQDVRSSQLTRMDPSVDNRRHVLASNMDALLIVASYLHPSVRWGLIDRYLVLAESESISATIVLNKEDLLVEAKDDLRLEIANRVNYYRSLGYQVISLAASQPKKYKAQVSELKAALKSKVVLLSGHSGVGKSSLVNLFNPEIVQDVEEDDNIFYKGRHTTSYASLIRLPGVGAVIDSPGIRSFCLEEKDALDLSYCFRDIRPYLGQCRYRGCRHLEEPKCAVKAAVADNDLPDWRYRSYQAILLGTGGREGRVRSVSLEE